MRLVRCLPALALLPLALAAPVAPAAAAPSDPAAIRCAGVELAPSLGADPDRNPDGSPVRITPDSRGRFVPVVMVHGWTGRSTHDDDRGGAFSHKIDLTTDQVAPVSTSRSLIGQLQRVPGAAVFTFDYPEHSARWVDDEHVGPALGKAVDCLFDATGEKVVVVAHSMGGLATRYALGQRAERAAKVSSVVTFGTPETGSLVAMLGNAALDIGAAANRAASVVRLILSACGDLTGATLGTGTPCDFLPEQVRAFSSPAGEALRYGSRQLAALKPFPKNVKVTALAGDTVMTVPKAGWFRLPWEVDEVPVGDLVVSTDSATAGVTEPTKASCAYQLNPVRAGTDRIGLMLRVTAENDVAQPITSVLGACFHGNLMRTIQLTNEATGIVDEDIRSRQPALEVNPADYAMPYGGYAFDSPSGRFLCGIVPPIAGDPGMAGCQGETRPVPPRPADCSPEIGWGGGMYVDDDGRVDYVCAGGLMFSDGNAKVLPYGAVLAVSGMTCTSAETGMRCADDGTGHGFRIASGSNERF
jgi:pimeloyl-ACP methyl ester carboxylesterase